MAKKIGRYEIYEKIGFGAFGEVYRGHDPEVNRPVAVKILSALSDPDNLARFRREAKAAGNLHHPNIVTIYDSGENEGVPFIIMELVEGRDLQKEVAARTLSLLEKVDIMYQVAEGLQYAHDNKVVHRDVKPANIMVLPDGSVKILDFGIARFDQPHAERQTRAGYLVGTILYMSPEQFQDGIVDSLCDIWAYGVVFYELLTGKHPFEAKDNAGLMYKVTRVDPPRISTLVNECPDALEQIVLRALARDRELRYQSLDDLQLDILPVLMELRRQHASGLFADAHSQFDAGQLDEAQATVRRILDLDPGMLEARQLRDQISKQMQQWKLRPRVDALLKTAEQEIAERRFEEAIESLASALRLQTDSGIRGRLEEAHRLAEMSARSSELIAQAEREFRLQDFGTALRHTAEALRLDPSYPQAQRLMDSIQQEMARRERKRRLDEALEKARGLLLIQAFDEVFAVLDGLRAEFPADPQADQLYAIAKARQEEREKRNRLNEVMQAAKTLLKERRFADAVDRLQRLRGDFAGDQHFTELLTFAEDELRRQMKDQEIGDLVEKSRQLQTQNQFEEALKLIDGGLQKYTSDGTLIREFQAIMAAKTAFDKAQAIQQAVERGEALRQQGRPADALNLIEAAVSRYGAEPVLLRFRRELEEEQQRLERAEALQKTLRQGEELLRQRNLKPAITLLQSALARYPDDAELQSLQARVMEAHRLAEQRRFVDEQLIRSLQLENAGQWDAALAVVDDALQHYPAAADLAVAQARLEKKRQEAQVRKEAASFKLQVGQAVAARDWEQATRLLEEARARIPAADFAEMSQQVEAARQRAELDALVAKAQDGLARGDLQRTQELLDTGLNQYGRHERLLRLRQILEREAAYRESIAAARKEFAERRFGPANEFLQKALESKPADREALALLDSIVAERDRAERAEMLAAGREKLERLIRERQFDSAVEFAESLLALAPDDAGLRARLAEVVRAKAEAEREARAARQRAEKERLEQEARLRAEREAQARVEREILTTSSEIDSLLKANDLDNATRVFELSKQKHGDDARLRDTQRRLAEAVAEKQRHDAMAVKKQLDENVQFTVYRPVAVQPARWYTLLAFAHLSGRRPDEPDPVQEVKRQAASVLAEDAGRYRQVTADSAQAVSRDCELTFVPEIPGIEFNPPRRSFLWQESVHREEFRMCAAQELQGQVARGRLTVLLGGIIIGDVALSIRVGAAEEPQQVSATAAVYRKIFASYSHRDVAIVEECERYARAVGDEYVRDMLHLRTGEVWDERLRQMIEQADVFQLFWSANAMRSPFVRREWEHALGLANKGQAFIRPVYWEEPLPADPKQNLPPEKLRRLHFHRLSVFSADAALKSQLREFRSNLQRAKPEVAKELDAARNWDQAARLLEEARARIPAGDFAELSRQMEAARTRAGLDALLTEAQDGLARGDLQRARELLEAGVKQYGRQERLQRLGQMVERETTYRESIAAAKKELAGKRLGPAREFVQKALEAKPADRDALALLDAIAAERDKAERVEKLAAGREKLARLVREKQFDSAVECAKSLLALAPDDAELRARLAEAEQEAKAARQRAEKERREAIARKERERAEREAQMRAEQEILTMKAEIDSLLMANDLDNATRVFELSKLKHGDDVRLRDSEMKLSEAAAEKQRRDEIQRLCDNARDQMRQGRFDEALHMLESGAVRFPEVEEFPGLLAEAEAGRRKAQRQQAIQQALAAAAAMVEKGQAEAALRSLEDQLHVFADSRELAEAAARLRSRVEEAKRQRSIGESTEAIERHIAEGKWAQAASLAEATQHQFPNSPEFAGLKRRAEAGKRQAEIEEVIAAAAKARQEGNLARAGEVVAAGRARFPDEPNLNKLFYEVEGARCEENIAQAKPLIEARKYDEAETLLHEALARRPKLAAAEELLRDIAGRKANDLRERRMREDARARTASGNKVKSRRPIIAIAATLVALAGGIAWWWIHQPGPTRPPTVLETWEHPTAVRGLPYSSTVHATGGSPPLSWSISKGSLPPGLTLNVSSGLIEGTPRVDGSYTFSAKVTDLEGRTSQRDFSITIKPPPPPVKPGETKTLVVENSGDLWTANQGLLFNAQLRAAGGSPPVTWTVPRRPPPRALVLDANTGRIHGIPLVSGVFRFRAKATDREGHTAVGEFTITVRPREEPPAAPTIPDDGVPPIAVRGERYVAVLHATGGTPPITWSILAGLPHGLNLDPASGRIDGIPTVDGTYNFVARATDRAGKSAGHAFTITVRPKSPPPPCVTKPFDITQYYDTRSRTVTWNGSLPAGADVTIRGRTASSGSVTDSLPPDAVPFRVTITPGNVKVKEAPSAANCWLSRLVLHNDGNATVSSITINWVVFQPRQ